jgi:hypothetical protein
MRCQNDGLISVEQQFCRLPLRPHRVFISSISIGSNVRASTRADGCDAVETLAKRVYSSRISPARSFRLPHLPPLAKTSSVNRNHTPHPAMVPLRAALILVLAVLLSPSGTRANTPWFPAPQSPRFVEISGFSKFPRTTNAESGMVVIESKWVPSPLEWDELIVSWNAETPPGTGLKFEARAMITNRPTKYFNLGLWADVTNSRPRESVLRQKDSDGDVLTDTLVLNQPADQWQLRLTLVPDSHGKLPDLKRVGLCFANRSSTPASQPPVTNAWGRTLNVPEKSQLSYAGGRDWCSPTSVSMVLAYWSRHLKRPDLNVDVPEVAAGVYDGNWPGTGNWPFNTAFAGRFPGMRAIVTRLNDVSELENLIAAGVPPIVSVSYSALYGRKNDQADGHLVVCVGFTAQGEPIVNDPWADFKKGDKVRAIVKRENFATAWARSRRTVYLIHPESVTLPSQSQRRW